MGGIGSRLAPDEALTAALFSAAEGFDAHPQGSCSIEDGAPFRDLAPPAGGLKYDLMDLHRPFPF
jgi:hypothetical protein